MAVAAPLDWDDLRYFLRALESGTLAGAARALGVEHTTVGRRLTALERSLGAPLVLRGPDGVEPTLLGEKLLPLVEEMERAAQALQTLVTSEKARVRLAVPSGFTNFFSARLATLRRDQPQLALELLSGARPVDLRRGEADLAIRVGPEAEQELVTRKLCVSGWSLYAARSYLAARPAPRDLDDLSGHDLIGYDKSLASLPAAKWIEQRAGTAALVLRSREMTDMLAAAVSGVGLALLPCQLGDLEPALIRITAEVLATRTVSLVYRREARQSESVRAVIHFVVDVIERNAKLIGGFGPS